MKVTARFIISEYDHPSGKTVACPFELYSLEDLQNASGDAIKKIFSRMLECARIEVEMAKALGPPKNL